MAHRNPTPAPVRVISDDPATDKIDFGFDAYADTLAGLIANKENTTPLVMGIHGPWGSGKTTLMNAIQDRLDDDHFTHGEPFRRCQTIRFQVWKYDREEEILAALVEAIFKAMAAHGFFTLAKAKVEAITRRIDQSKIFPAVSKLVTGVDVSEFFSELPNKEKLGFYDTFQKFFDDLVWTFLNWRFKLSGQEKPDDKKGVLVIFIDDLDRCPPGRIVKVLETIKLFMDRSGCIFVLGAANEILEDALARTHGPLGARRFLEKIFQATFNLPQVAIESFGALIEDSGGDLSAFAKHLPLIIPAMGHNPRRLKRFVNDMNLLKSLLQNSNASIGFDKVLCWGVIEHCFVELAKEIKDNPDNLLALQKQIRRLMAKADENPLWRISDRRLKSEKVPQAFHHYIQQPYLAELVSRCSMAGQEFSRLLALSASVQACRETTPPD